MSKIIRVGWLWLAACATFACSAQKPLVPPGSGEQCATTTTSSESARLTPARASGPSQAITLAAGESLCLEAKPGPRWVELEKLTRVGKASDLSIRMQSDGGGSTLSVRNPFERALTFDALVVLENGDRFPSSTCPVGAHAEHSEHWEEPVTRVILSDFSVRSASSAAQGCE
jgi:hypothetical protein